MTLRIKRNDTVYVRSGKDKGKTGRVLFVLPKDGKAIVENVNLVKKHQRQQSQDKPGGIITKEAPIQLSNLMLLCGKCNKPVRIGSKVDDAGSRVRVCVKCRSAI